MKRLVSGAQRGAVVWLIYATVEFIFCAPVPLFLFGGYATAEWQWRLRVLFFYAYGILGFLLGGFVTWILGLLGPRIPFRRDLETEGLHDAAAVFSILVAFAANLQFPRYSLPEIARLLIFVCPLLGVAQAASLVSTKWARRSSVLLNPWTVSLLLTAPFTVTGYVGNDVSGVTLSIGLGCVAAIALPAYLLAMWPRARETFSYYSSTSRAPLLLAGVLFYAVAGSVLLSAPPRTTVPAPPAIHRAASPTPVILFVMDTVRADHLSVYGYGRDTTPRLREFAAGATLYTHAFSCADMTLASHGCMFTGLYASRHGAHYAPPVAPQGVPLAPSIPTLPEVLSSHGYLTAGLVANSAYLSYPFGLPRGFQFYSLRSPAVMTRREAYMRRFVRRFLTPFASTLESDRLFRRADELNLEVLQALDVLRQAEAPFLLFVNYMDAHTPYLPPAPYDRSYPGKREDMTYYYLERLRADVNASRRVISRSERDHILSQYDGSLAFLDEQLGRVFQKLRELGLYDRALIIVTADHGEALGDRNLLEHGVSVYQDQIGVPLIIKYPGQREGRVVDAPAGGADVLPTVLDVVGLPAPGATDGMSLQPGRVLDGRSLMAESFPNSSGTPAFRSPRLQRTERALISGTMKLIESTDGKRELYDLAQDPQEQHNLYRPADPLVAKSEAELNRILETLPKQQVAPAALDRRTRERLRSLGYLQ